jgi:hypothetical protein
MSDYARMMEIAMKADPEQAELARGINPKDPIQHQEAPASEAHPMGATGATGATGAHTPPPTQHAEPPKPAQRK